MEFSESKDAAFCLCCYLFKPNIGEQIGGNCFVGERYSNWKKKKEKFDVHIGGPNSQAWNKYKEFMVPNQHIEAVFYQHSNQDRKDYRIRLNASVDCVRFFLRQGLAFHDD